jgi:hypothetical protein
LFQDAENLVGVGPGAAGAVDELGIVDLADDVAGVVDHDRGHAFVGQQVGGCE